MGHDGDGAGDTADERMLAIDPGVDDRDAHAAAGRALERPFAGDSGGPGGRQTLLGARGKAPGG
jgi:hypothetical protein